jgi:hypothetical protein
MGSATRSALNWCTIADGPACTITHAKSAVPTIARSELVLFMYRFPALPSERLDFEFDPNVVITKTQRQTFL